MSSFMMHDLKNLTNSLSLISQNARHNMDNPEFQRDAIKTIDTTVSRMKGLIERLASVPRRFELKKESVELDDVVNRAVKQAVVPQGRNVAITKEMDGIPAICIDSEAMEMVFINLLTNAYGAIEREGVVKILASEESGNVKIAVADNGIGMSDDFMRNSLFHPFKTTKKTGFGIGLYQCKTIIDAHGGRIDVESAEGEGTTFTITLPIK
jgi:putative PEP-CTERM system histidine kinase